MASDHHHGTRRDTSSGRAISHRPPEQTWPNDSTPSVRLPVPSAVNRPWDELWRSLTAEGSDRLVLNGSGLFDSAADIETVLHSIVQTLSRTGVSYSSVVLFDERSGRQSHFMFHVADASKQRAVAKLFRDAPIALDSGFMGSIMARRTPLVMNKAMVDTLGDDSPVAPNATRWIELLEIQSFLAVPIIGKEAVRGVIAAVSDDPANPMTSEDLWLWTQLADHAAVAIEHSRALGIIEAQRQELQRLLTEHVETQERERQRIALDVHDSVLQTLIAALQGVRGLHVKEANRQQMIEAQLRSSIEELRSMVRNLRPVALDTLGLVQAIEVALEEFEKRELIVAHFHHSGLPVRIGDLAEVTLYRIFQEALSNVRRHALASSVEVSLTFTSAHAEITISDDGLGAAATAVPGFGISGMKERATAVGGHVSVEPRPGGGTVVVARIPRTIAEEVAR